jgi:predicted secreted hydrolase
MRYLLKSSLLIIFLLTNIPSAGAEDFQTARAGRVWQFPRDHGAHPEFKTEWWYYSGHLRSKEGESFGYQLTFFRVALRQPDPRAKSAWAAHTVYFAHLALSAPGRGAFIFREKAGRGAMGLAGAETGRVQVWVDDWQAAGQGGEQHLRAKTDDLSLDLILTPLKPPVLHGEKGYSRKAAGTDTASHYYSIPRLATQGRIKLGQQTLEVTGTSWLDREFSTSHLAPDQVGWDWFALQLADGTDIMLYLLRLKDGRIDPASSGTLIDPQGQARHLTLAEFQVKATGTWKSPHSGATYPSGWQIAIPPAGYLLTLTPTLAHQELRTGGSTQITYWEGQVHIQGHQNNQPLTGQGYTELTGYTGSLGGRF